jgi:hypothetical protein
MNIKISDEDIIRKWFPDKFSYFNFDDSHMFTCLNASTIISDEYIIDINNIINKLSDIDSINSLANRINEAKFEVYKKSTNIKMAK